MSYESFDLTKAFPCSLHASASELMSAVSQPIPYKGTFSVLVEGETLVIPYRIYDDVSGRYLTEISRLQLELFHCLMTRHHSGLVREQHLTQILSISHAWVPPFVLQLVGEYVIEILNVIHNNLHELDTELYRRFLAQNEDFFRVTKQRVISYWNCYHRKGRKEDYIGFQLIGFFDQLA